MYEYTVQETGVPVMAALMDVLFCLLFLVTPTSISDIGRLMRDRALLSRMLDERRHQYEMSARTIEIINRKSHDLKHQIAALRHVSSAEAEGTLREIENSVRIYDSVLQTDNDALNTLLTEKKLVCDGRGISLTTMVDGETIAFMDPIDLYTLLGNALDNAIECELQLLASRTEGMTGSGGSAKESTRPDCRQSGRVTMTMRYTILFVSV